MSDSQSSGVQRCCLTIVEATSPLKAILMLTRETAAGEA